MSNRNISQLGNQTAGQFVMIGNCSPDSQHWEPARHHANVSYSFFRYTNGLLSNNTEQRLQHRKWTGEENKLAFDGYFRSKSKKESIEKE